jgi:polyisoprenyl-phosphate glycosyltransferase
MTKPLVTLIIPARNEALNLPRVEQEVVAMIDSQPQYTFECVLVDNASTDTTPELCRELCARDPRWKYLRFSRNFTVEMSMTAGYHFARGEAIIVLYSDLQDPPSVIPQFLSKWQEGYDVVYGVRTVRPGDPQWRNAAVMVAYRVIAWFADVPIPTDAGDFRLITRPVCDALNRMGEYNRYMRGMIAWLGFKQIGVYYERQPRKAGKSSAPFWSIFFFTLNAITSFSLRPLRLFAGFGMVLIVLSVLMGVIYTVLFFTENPPPGITTLIVLAFLAIGINSLGIGILGEYIGRTYSEVKQRPLYVIEEAIGLERSTAERAQLLDHVQR